MDLKTKIKNTLPKGYQHLLYKVYFDLLPLRAALYQGEQFVCPCCNGRFSKFLSAQPGRKKLKNEQCPRCDSWRRHRAMWLYLQNRTNLFSEPLKVLHVAPEYIFQEKLKSRENLDYVSADLSSPLAMVEMDITNISYQENCFDAILCSHVLEHIEDDRKAIKELLRVLKPSGWAILQVPIDRKREQTFEDQSISSPQERERLFWQHDHVRLYGLDYKDRLEEAGFTVEVDSYLKQLEKDTVYKYGLTREDIYLCTKRMQVA